MKKESAQKTDGRFVVRKSGSGKGHGLFALKPIKKGNFILEYIGTKIPTPLADTLATRYLFEMALKWKLTEIHVEAVAAQKFLLYHLRYFIEQEKGNRPELTNLRIVELKCSQAANAKFERIDATVPVVERHEVWINATTSDNFREEAEAYGQKKGLIDLLDVFGHSMNLWKFDTVTEDEVEDFLSRRLAIYKRGVGRMS